MSSLVVCHNISQWKWGHLALTIIAKPVHTHRTMLCTCSDVFSWDNGALRGEGVGSGMSLSRKAWWSCTRWIRNSCLYDNLRLVGTRCHVSVRDGKFPGDYSATAIPEIPVKSHVRFAQVLAGVVKGDAEGHRSVLDKLPIAFIFVIYLSQGNRKGNLV